MWRCVGASFLLMDLAGESRLIIPPSHRTFYEASARYFSQYSLLASVIMILSTIESVDFLLQKDINRRPMSGYLYEDFHTCIY